VANALLRGNTGLQAFTDEKVKDPEIKKLMAKISVLQDNAITALDSKVELETASGKIFSSYSDIFKEIPALEIKQEKIKAKFLDLSEPVLGAEKSQKLLDLVSDIENVANLNCLSEYV
jgi:2-methylcitrate dehydratase PrpD